MKENFPFSLPLLSASSFCTPTLSPAAIEQKLSRAKVLDVVYAPRRPTYEVSEELCHFPFCSSSPQQPLKETNFASAGQKRCCNQRNGRPSHHDFSSFYQPPIGFDQGSISVAPCACPHRISKAAGGPVIRISTNFGCSDLILDFPFFSFWSRRTCGPADLRSLGPSGSPSGRTTEGGGRFLEERGWRVFP